MNSENISPNVGRNTSEDNGSPKPQTLKTRKALSPLNIVKIVAKEVSGNNEGGCQAPTKTRFPSRTRAGPKPPKASVTSKNGSQIAGSLRPTSSLGRSRSTSSVQRLQGTRSYDSDDMSVSSLNSVSSDRSLRSSSTVRSKGLISVASNRAQPTAASRRPLTRSSSTTRCINTAQEPFTSGRQMSLSAPSSPQMKGRTNDNTERSVDIKSFALRTRDQSNERGSSWVEEQRKIKEERKMRSNQKSNESAGNDVLVNELNRSLLRIQQGYGRPTSKENDPTETPSKKTAIYTSISNKIASGLLSPFKSPKRGASTQHKTGSNVGKNIGSPSNTKRLHEETTNNILAEISGFDPNILQVQTLHDSLFSDGTGISDEELRQVLNWKSQRANKWELKKQLEEANNNIKMLKDTTNALIRGKNKFFLACLESEKSMRLRAINCIHQIDDEKNHLKEHIKLLELSSSKIQVDSNDTIRVLADSHDKIQIMESEIDALRKKSEEAETEKMKMAVALQVEKSRNDEMLKQLESWRADLTALEGSKLDAIKEAEGQVSNTFQKESKILREEIATLSRRLEEKNTDCDQFKFRVHELESILSHKEAELLRYAVELETIVARTAVKEKDMSELMKTVGEIQRSGCAREEEAHRLRKEAEAHALEYEKKVLELTAEISLLRHDNDILNDDLRRTKSDLDKAETNIQELNYKVDKMNNEMSLFHSTLQLEKELRSRSEQKEREERNERIALTAQMVAMTKEHAQLESQLRQANETLEAQWQAKVSEKEILLTQRQNEISTTREVIAGLEAEICSLTYAIKEQKTQAEAKRAEEISRLNGEINILKERLKLEEEKMASVGIQNAKNVEQFMQQIQNFNKERRRMHNTIQELRGNVRVFARIRPFLPDDNVSDDAQPSIIAKGEDALKMIMPEDKLKYDFTFDRVFSPGIGQEAVFTEVSEFVQSALDGYNVCLFSYGQTGSGKTYTMQGFGTGQMRGIIPRAIEQVGSYKNQLERDGWRYDMQVSFLEIYNETIRDLLRDDGSDLLKHEVKVDAEGRRYVSDLTMVPLDPNDGDAVEAVMRQAAKHRAVGSTDMNAVSSRSHSVFTLHLTAFHQENCQALRGTLNLVDLAGSERLSRSNATGDRAKEAVAINKSLSALTDVFVAIGRKASHIPFRNSKLTYLLQPSLSGDGKTLMMVNLSPTEMSAQESLCSLRFAAQVNQCELGKAKRSVEYCDSLEEDEVRVVKFSGRIASAYSPLTHGSDAPSKKRNVSRLEDSSRNVKARSRNN